MVLAGKKFLAEVISITEMYIEKFSVWKVDV